MGPTVADQPIRTAQGYGELEPFAGRIGMDGLQLLQELASLAGPVGHLPALVAGSLGIGPVGDEGVQVLGPESAQHQPRCGQCREGGITHRLPPLPTTASRRLVDPCDRIDLFFRYPARRTMPPSTRAAC